ncbi:MAG: ATP-binding protein [Myxococcales bacterium]
MATLDSTTCDQEAIQIPGAIQPFGSLVAFKEGSHRLEWWSEDFPSHPLAARADGEALFGGDGLLDTPRTLQDRDGRSWRLAPHSHGGKTIVEIEPCVDEPIDAIRAIQLGITEMVSAMQEAGSLQALCEAGARNLRRITGFDRVMIYRFHADAHGEVVAESRDAALEPFLGLHYPAGDIPSQARALFLSNWLRMIPDISYRPVPLLAARAGLGPLDLSRAQLRSVSPIHLEYLRNMQVRASLTVSILHQGQLWGLIACHHCTGPRTPGREVRSACELAGKVISSLLAIKRSQETASLRQRAKGILGQLVQRMAVEDDLADALAGGVPSVLDLIASEGAAAIYVENRWTLLGRTPSIEQIQSLAAWLRSEGRPDVFHTDHLAGDYPAAEPYADLASGLLSLSIPEGDGNFVLWFRPEILQTVRWGGSPEKPTIADGAGLHPRKSFAEWKQSVRSTSAPWQDWEAEIAAELRVAILAADLRAQFRKEQQARLEAEAASKVKQDLMAIVSHDLKNPLHTIGISLALIRRSLAAKQPDRADLILASIERSATRMMRLIEDLLDVARVESGEVALATEDVDCSELVAEARAIILPLAGDKSIDLLIVEPLSPVRARCDRERILQVLSNLVGNAIKFTAPGGSVTLGARQDAGEALFQVVDTGPGISGENLSRVFDRFWQAKETRLLGTGLGLAIAKGIVSAHGGRIWVESVPGKGATFLFTLPLSTSA